MTAEEIAQRLNGKANGKRDHWEACCPAHEDHDPSLSISRGKNGGTVLHCHAGCRPEEVCAALGLTLADLMPEERKQGKEIAATYDYTDASGRLFFQVVRYIPKDFRVRRPDGNGGWFWNLGDTPRLLFQLPLVIAAKEAGEAIYLTEGEKDALALTSLGLVATTHPGGAGKWRREYTEALADCHVMMVPDQDEPGRKHAETVRLALEPVAASFQILNLPTGKDAADWVRGGGTAETLTALLRTIPPPSLPPPDTQFKPGESPTERCTDTGNARRFARLYGHVVRYCWPMAEWFTYEAGVWSADGTGKIPALAKESVQSLQEEAKNVESDDVRKALQLWAIKSESAPRINALMDLARSEAGIPVAPPQLDAQPDLLNLSNGTLHLPTQQMQAHNPADLLTRQLPYAYDPHVKAPRWEDFLERVMDGRSDMIAFLQRAVGYSLTGLQSEQCFFFLYGAGANGKSVFLNTLQALFGPAGHTAAFSTFLRSRDAASAGRARPDIARLAGARLVTSTEAGEGQSFDEAFLKQVTGGEPVVARAMYQSEIEFIPQFTLWLAANHRPTIRGTDLAIWRRVCLVPFDVTIPEEDRDGRLLLTTHDNPLIRELPGILNWALDGYRAWRSEGLQKPAAVLMATEEYREQSDTVGRFLAEACHINTESRERASVLYASYKRWAEQNGESCRSQTWFGGQLRDRSFHSVKSGGTTTYIGVALLGGDRGILSPSSPLGE